MLAGLSSFLIASDFVMFGNFFRWLKSLIAQCGNYLKFFVQSRARYYFILGCLILFVFNYFNLSLLNLVKTCPSGYIFVDANSKLNVGSFCVMAYEAKKDAKTNLPISIPYQQPWTSISWREAKDACSSLGKNYSLILDRQWVSIANQVTSTAINNLVENDNPLFSSGNSEKMGFALGAKYADSPYVWGCNKNVSASNSDNRFIDWFCELRGGGNSLIKKGFAGTATTFQQQWGLDTSNYTGNRKLLRTHLLPSKQIIWDLAGNVWEWTDSDILIEAKSDNQGDFYSDSKGIDGDLPSAKNQVTSANYVEFDQILDWKKLDYAKPDYNGRILNSYNGVGKIYLNPGDSWGAGNDEEKKMKVILRGGAYGNPSEAGIFAINLSYAPSGFQPYIGFRCVKNF
jgi:formylglycine-generating enzyme required for sulfatase activity